jgi:hypothetical protein
MTNFSDLKPHEIILLLPGNWLSDVQQLRCVSDRYQTRAMWSPSALLRLTAAKPVGTLAIVPATMVMSDTKEQTRGGARLLFANVVQTFSHIISSQRANAVPPSPSLVTLMMEAISSYETSVLTSHTAKHPRSRIWKSERWYTRCICTRMSFDLAQSWYTRCICTRMSFDLAQSLDIWSTSFQVAKRPTSLSLWCNRRWTNEGWCNYCINAVTYYS